MIKWNVILINKYSNNVALDSG